MGFFRKKDEVFVGAVKKGKKNKRLPKIESLEDQAQDMMQENEIIEDAYSDSFLPPDETEQIVTPQEKRPKFGKKDKSTKAAPKTEAPFYRNRLVIGISCISVATLIAFVFVPVMSYLVTTDMITVARVVAPVAKGNVIDIIAVKNVSVPARGVIEGTIQDATLAAGKYATVDLTPGDLLTEQKLADTMPWANAYLYTLPQTNKMAISTTIQSFAGGLSGKLHGGDIVSVLATLKQKDAEDTSYQAIQPTELIYMRVLAVTDKWGGDKKAAEGDEEKQTEEDEHPVTVTLLADARQAAAIAGLEVNANLHIALVSRGDEESAQYYLSVQEGYLEELEQEAASESISDEEFEEMMTTTETTKTTETTETIETSQESEAG